MDIIHLIDTIFQTVDCPFINWDSSIYLYDGLFIVVSMYADFDDNVTLFCLCENDEKLFLKYSTFNQCIKTGVIVYYSNKLYNNIFKN